MFDYPVAGVSASATGPTAEGDAVALKEYEVVVNGFATTMKLDEENARRLGVWREAEPEPEVKQAEPKPNKARKPRNKASGKS